MEIRVTQEAPTSALAVQLFEELAAFYAERYGIPGFGAFPIERLTVPGARFVVAWRGVEAAGCGAILPMEEPECAEIKRMFVRPQVRRQGVAQALLQALEHLARAAGYHTLYLETGKLVPEAMHLYGRAGYKPIPCWGRYATLEESVCFRKLLITTYEPDSTV